MSFFGSNSDYGRMLIGIAVVEFNRFQSAGIDEKHTWIADGVAAITYDITTFYHYKPSTGEYERKVKRTEISKYIRFNWGWGGNNDGYFLQGVYDPSKSTEIEDDHFVRSNFSADFYGYYYE